MLNTGMESDTQPQPDIYSAVAGLSSALAATVGLFERYVDVWERREEELRDAHLDLANALNRRMDGLHTRLDVLEASNVPSDVRAV